MFLGEFFHKLDSKNRIMIPKDYRNFLNEDFYITKGPEHSLIIYTKEQFQKRSNAIENLDFNSKKNRALKRLFFSSTVKTHVDKQGRFLLNKNLLDYASIKEDVAIIGNDKVFEIWDRKLWEEYIEEVELNISEIMDE